MYYYPFVMQKIIILLLCFVSSIFMFWNTVYSADPDPRISSFTYTITGPDSYKKTVSSDTEFKLLKSNLADGKYTIKATAIERYTGNTDTETVQYWIDTTAPSVSAFSGIGGWTNQNVDVTIGCNDGPTSRGSGCESNIRYKIKRTWVTAAKPSCSDGWWTNKSSRNITVIHPTQSINQHAYICVQVQDKMWLWSATKISPVIKFDTKAPTINDIDASSFIPHPSWALEANSSQSIRFEVDTNAWSWLKSITANMESPYSVNQVVSKTQNNNSTYSQFFNTSIVDGNDRRRDNNTAREYTFTITELCDQAGNCANIPAAKYDYNVYANARNIHTSNTRVISSTALRSWNVADGTPRALTLQLKDDYGNDIIPANWINRKIDFEFTIENHLAENQYEYGINPNNYTWNSAVYARDSSYRNFKGAWQSGANDILENMAVQSNDTYNIDFKVYAPTANSQGDESKWNGSFEITEIEALVNSDLNTWADRSIAIQNDNIEFNFKPLYYTAFDGASEIKSTWFIEWVIQNGNVDIVKNWNLATSLTSDYKTHLKFGSLLWNQVSDAFELYYKIWILANNEKPTDEVEKSTILASQLHIASTESSFTSSQNIATRLNQVDQIFVNQSTYLSTHISYKISHPNGWANKLNITYNWEVVGEYIWWNTSINNTAQSTLKVIGQIHSQELKNNVAGVATWTTDTQNKPYVQNSFWQLSKSILRADIKKKVYSIIKDEQWVTFGTTYQVNDLNSPTWEEPSGGDWSILWNKDILYFGWLNGGNVTIWSNPDDNFSLSVEHNKTIIIIWWNIYLKDNMYYVPNTPSNLGIIVLKDENWKGWNIYIDPRVTNIVGSMYAEWSLLSYNDSKWELAWNATQEDLKNQLHIYGSLFTENTIWWASVLDDDTGLYDCPFNISEWSCTKEVAQKYDLNYLRRYYRYDHDNDDTTPSVPANQWKVIGGFICDTTTDYACNYSGSPIIQTPVDLEDAIYNLNWPSLNKDFPVVIKYNSQVQITPPPLFGE